MRFVKHQYKYFPYEEKLAELEIKQLLGISKLSEIGSGYECAEVERPELASRLTYISNFEIGGATCQTNQRLLESGSTNGGRRQATRYSSHGLHEYKGKFNPQVVKFLLNFYSITDGSLVLDPFCGSGTTLLEAAHLNVNSIGVDANPLAKLIASTKVSLIHCNLSKVESELRMIFQKSFSKKKLQINSDEYTKYLASWFPETTLQTIEKLRTYLLEAPRLTRDVGLVLVSNQLREFSFQDPADLRIRRRSEAPEILSLRDALELSLSRLVAELRSSRRILGTSSARAKIISGSISDFRVTDSLAPDGQIDLVITSPPYAMALPYIDTQRLSLVWLRMVKPSMLRQSEQLQIGNREFGKAKISENMEAIKLNSANLPDEQISLCKSMFSSLSSADGFRRQAVPALMYQYFLEMQMMFVNVRTVVSPGVPFALVVGSNRTTLGGHEYCVDTPQHLANIASESGWVFEKLINLEAYQRFGLHAANGINLESLVMLRSK